MARKYKRGGLGIRSDLVFARDTTLFRVDLLHQILHFALRRTDGNFGASVECLYAAPADLCKCSGRGQMH